MVTTCTPDLRRQVMQLSPELKKTVQHLHARHTRKSRQLTLRQVMQEIPSEYQGNWPRPTSNVPAAALW
jgi:hypothetical protein